ncbi:MAG TPA: preprotein translocase subunit SecG [Thermoleophilia bacterium]|nr:preprotein translocase subunit SecG [Thermoleophilia bacterium]
MLARVHSRLEEVNQLLNAILVVIQLILAVLVIVLVLMHSGKDAGMASVTGFSFASSASVMERNLTRYTIIAGVVFFLNTFVLIWRLG